jgi:inner membrane protein
MPGGRTHCIAGALLSAYALYQVDGPLSYLFIGGAMALLPDADIRRSFAGRVLPLWLLCRHRCFTHSFAALLAVSLIAFFLDPWMGIATLVGYASHLLLDWLTPRGVQLMWPKPKYYSIRKW